MTVYLVGAGPGDPGPHHRQGRRRPAAAPRSWSTTACRWPSLLDLAPAGAERISVGKARGRAPTPQAEINALAGRARSRRPHRRAAQGRRSRSCSPAAARRPRRSWPPACLRGGAGHHVGHRRARLRRHPGDHAPRGAVVHRRHRPRGPVVGASPSTGPAIARRRRHHRRADGGGPHRHHRRGPAGRRVGARHAGGRPSTGAPGPSRRYGAPPSPPSPTTSCRRRPPSWWGRWRPTT